MKRYNKKGAELSMNVIIITILVILVLVIVALIFTGGMSTLSDRIRNIFKKSATDAQTAVIECQSICQNHQAAPLDEYVNQFCRDKTFNLDTDGDGVVDKSDQTCQDLQVGCPTITCP
jgi:flagellar basal body-associated protein FliL